MSKIPAEIQDLIDGASEKVEKEDYVYGVYNEKHQGFFHKINDFLIDHSRISLKEKSYFFHLMAVMIDAGIPMVKTLDVLRKKTENERFRRILNTLKYEVVNGRKLSDSMASFPDVFTESELGVIKAGEAVGNLDQMLLKLSAQVDQMNELSIKLRGAMVYPLTVLVALAISIGILMVFVVPTLTRLFTESGVDLPWTTDLIINTSNFVSNYWGLILLALLVLYGFYRFYVSTESGRLRVDYTLIKLPVLGELIRKVIVMRIVSLIGILIEAGLPVPEVLEIVSRAAGNEVYKLKMSDVNEQVKLGKKISESIQKSTFLFPDTVGAMLEIGESSAALGSISKKVAKQYDREIGHLLKKLTNLMEPAIIVIVGLAVGIVAVSILSPIFSLSERIV